MSPVRYELGFYIPEDAILHSHRRENLRTYMFQETCIFHNYLCADSVLRGALHVARDVHYIIQLCRN
jgi:hypothetical protein